MFTHKRLVLLGALGPFLLFAFLLLAHPWVPGHDTLGSLFWVDVFLKHFHSSSTWPVWIPEFGWGQSIEKSLIAFFTPVEIFLMPIASRFSEINSATFFYIAMLANELFFLVGLYLFSRVWFSRLSSRLFLLWTAGVLCLWLTQRVWAFQLFYHLPIAMYFASRGIEERAWGKVGVGFSIAIFFSMLGNIIYPFPMVVAFYALYCVLVFWAKHVSLKEMKFPSVVKTAGLVGVVAISLLSPLSVLLNADETSFLTNDRKADGKLDYAVYLNYSKQETVPGLRNILNPFDFSFDPFVLDAQNQTDYGNLPIYGGAFLIPLVLVALIFSVGRGPFIFACLGAVCFFVILGSSTFLAPLFFHLPGFQFFRHFSLLAPLLRFFLLILATFGVEVLAENISPTTITKKVYSVFLGGTFFVLLLHFYFIFSSDRLAGQFFVMRTLVPLLCSLVVVGMVIRKWFGVAGGVSLVSVLCVAALLDTVSYRAGYLHASMTMLNEKQWNAFSDKEVRYHPRRSMSFLKQPAYREWGTVLERWRGAENAITVAFLGEEVCYADYRLDTATPDAAVIQRRLKDVWPWPGRVARALACHQNKLSWAPPVRFVESEGLLLNELLRDSAELSPLVVGGEVPQEWRSFFSQSVNAPEMPVDVRRYQWNEMQLEVAAATYPRLLYYSGSWSPRWSAVVSGNEVPLVKANGAFQLVPVPPGATEISLSYDAGPLPVLLWLMWGLCGFALIAPIAALVELRLSSTRASSCRTGPSTSVPVASGSSY